MTVEGQTAYIRDLMSILRAVPEERGKGFFWWELTWLLVGQSARLGVPRQRGAWRHRMGQPGPVRLQRKCPARPGHTLRDRMAYWSQPQISVNGLKLAGTV